MEHAIIDGYNLIHSIPSLRKTLLHDAHSARELLIYAIARLTHQRSFRCTLVFDGFEQNDSKKTAVHAPVHVLYSAPLSADAKIRSMIDHSKKRPALIIVSSDREVISYAKACSCQTHSAKYFANMLAETDDVVTEKSDVSLTKHQIDQWLKIFGEK